MRILMLTCHAGIQGPFPKILPLLADALRANGCAVETEPWARRHDRETFFEKVLRIPGDLLRIFNRLRRERYDMLVVHTTTEWPNYSRDLPVLMLCRRLVPKIVLQFHGSTPALVLGPGKEAFKAATRMVLRYTDAVFVLSTEEQREWHRFFPGGRFEVVTNPFESALPATLIPQPSMDLGLPSGVPILFYAGRLMAPKGVFDLLEALSALKGKVPFHLLAAGAGPEQEAFRERINDLGLNVHVTCAGYLRGDHLRAAYLAADLFVFPSWSEGFPTVITEAMDAGLPIVTTHLRGMVDHLHEGVHARFVPVRDPKKLAKAIVDLLADEPLRKRMGLANREKVKDFSPETVARKYFGLLRDVAGFQVSGAECSATAANTVSPACEARSL